jgi:hypothetical protein
LLCFTLAALVVLNVLLKVFVTGPIGSITTAANRTPEGGVPVADIPVAATTRSQRSPTPSIGCAVCVRLKRGSAGRADAAGFAPLAGRLGPRERFRIAGRTIV